MSDKPTYRYITNFILKHVPVCNACYKTSMTFAIHKVSQARRYS